MKIIKGNPQVGDLCGRLRASASLTLATLCFWSAAAGPNLGASTTIAFNDFSNPSGLQLNGNALIASTTDGSVLRVTPSGLFQSGSAFLNSPISLADHASFSTSFRFRISDPGLNGDSDGPGGDGFVFVMQPVGDTALGGSGGCLGFCGVQPSIGVEFDTYDGGLPLDINGNHIGVDLNGALESTISAPVADRLNNGEAWFAWVDYSGTSHDLEIRVSESATRPVNPSLSYNADIPALLGSTLIFPGFTSGTGTAFNNHDILSWGMSVAGPSLTLLAQGTSIDRPRAVSSDGQVVVGFSWRWQNGVFTSLQDAFPLAPDGQWFLPTGLTGDGSAVVGVGNNNDSFLYSIAAGSYSSLLPPPGTPPPTGTHGGTGATGISADSRTVIGNFDDWGPVKWLDGTVTVLPSYFGTAQALAVSGDGSVIAGWNGGLDSSGNAHYYPTQWSGGVPSALPVIQYGSVIDGRALAVSGDGFSIAGYESGPTGQPEAVLWQKGAVQALAAPPGTYASQAFGVSDGGNRVVGKFAISCCSAADNRAFLWSREDGVMKDLGDVLTGLGIDTTGWVFYEADAITPDGRFVVGKGSAGVFIVDLGMALSSVGGPVLPPGVQWDKSFGGSSTDQMTSLEQTSDGGYILGGASYTEASTSGSKTTGGFGDYDYWLVKLDANGNELWDKSFGGSSADALASVQETSDGGYILGGSSISGISGNKSAAGFGDFDYWVIKLDANGNKFWDKSFGGAGADVLTSLQQTSDGGYILGGYSNSGASGNKSAAGLGGFDYWVVKIDANGNKTWDKSFGGSNADALESIQQTSDGGFILGGMSNSRVSANKTSGGFGGDDYWIVKIDANGNEVWDKTFGGSSTDSLRALEQTSDGGYILGGWSFSDVSGNKSSANLGAPGEPDFWVIRIDANGNKLWDASYGGVFDDWLFSLHQTSDGGFIFGGRSGSPISGNKTSRSFGSEDYWIVKTDANGNKLWDESFGGTDDDELLSLQPTRDGGYILGGFSFSGVSGNKTADSAGNADYWVVKLGPETPVTPVNHAPIARADAYSTPEDTPLHISAPGVLANDTDVDGDPLTLVEVRVPDHGSIFADLDGSFTYTPPPQYVGPDSFRYIISDGHGGGATNFAFISVTSPNVSNLQTTAVDAGETASVSTAPMAAGQSGVSATLDNTRGSAVAVTVASYSSNPSGVAFSAGGGFSDVQITGVDEQATATVRFYYPSTVAPATEVALALVYFNGTDWVSVRSDGNSPPIKDTTDNLDATVSGGRFTVAFSNTSTPRITELQGTFFSVGIPDTTPPSVFCPNVTVSCSADLLVPVIYPTATVTDNVDPAPKVTYSIPTGTGFPIGITSVICSAMDASGNSSSTTFTVTRAPLDFTGFLSPIGGAESTGGTFASPVRAFKMGSTIPVKFTASCGGSPVLTGIHRLQVVRFSSTTASDTPIDATPQDAATTGDRFRLSNGQWQFNLDTKASGMTVGTWQLVTTLSDGSRHVAWIELK